MQNRTFQISESSATNFKFMCKSLGLKSTFWSRYFIENEIEFLLGRRNIYSVGRNNEEGFKLLEQARKAEGLVRFDVPLSEGVNNQLVYTSGELRVSKGAFVEFALEFACYRLLGVKDQYENLRRLEVEQVFFLQHLAKNSVTYKSHSEFYRQRLDFTSYRADKHKRVNPINIAES
ncbi:hypothetical protein [Glaciecola sp. MF2-115]|uniref:hypothetical protein n=1 Tax=Glaciecola sp. MF2-115 TaxID=3384827 RepID=UPI0039A3D366